MDVRIQAIHFDATAQLEAFIQKKVSKLEQYFDGIILAEVTLKVVKPETVKNRLAVYHEQTQPLIDFYEKKGVLKTVDGTLPMEEVFAAITAILG